jgi:hypothetical protein
VISLNPYQLLSPTVAWLNQDQTPVVSFYNLIRALYNRTGGQSGVPFQASANLAAAGSTQATATAATLDYNEFTSGAGGAILAALQPSQFQVVYNGIGGNLSVYPATSGEIDALGVNSPYTLGSGKTQIFWCPKLLTSGATFYRSTQLG